jgi:hypothetical protein
MLPRCGTDCIRAALRFDPDFFLVAMSNPLRYEKAFSSASSAPNFTPSLGLSLLRQVASNFC